MKRAVLSLALLAALAGNPAGAQHVDSLAIRGHTRFLADDLLAGRGTGTAGERLAAAYIASQLERLGLQPLGATGSYLLPVPLRAAVIGPGSRATVTRGDGTAELASGRDFVVNTGGSNAFRDFGGQVVLAGDPAAALATLRKHGDFRGRVIALTTTAGAAAPTLVPALRAGGAAGLVVLVPDTAQFELFVRSRGDRRYFVDAIVDDPVWQPDLPNIIAGPALTAALLAGAPLTRALLAGDSTASALDLGRQLSVTIEASVEAVPTANLAAVLPGSDPTRRAELVVYTAHYDHLGIGAPDSSGDTIYNGFSDNAAGVAMVLAIAEALRAAPPPTSTAFVFFTGEERGLLGSTYFAAFPPIPLARIRGVINLDAGAPPAPPRSWRIAGGSGTRLGALAEQVARAAGWTAALGAASPNSDYWPFLARGVPAVFLIPGNEWDNVSGAQQQALRSRWDRYHQAGDAWHPEFPFAGLGRYADFALRLGLALARDTSSN